MQTHAQGCRWGTHLLCVAACALAVWGLWEVSHITLLGNLHEIIPGRLYRGAQPSPESLERLVHQYHIRTVLNVRGCCFPDKWYVGEAEVCQRLGIQLEDVTF